MRLYRRALRTVLLLAFIAFLAHLPALIGVMPGAMPSTGDTLGAFVPWHEFTRQSLWQRSEIPLWNPYLYCGMPFLANGQSGLFYPPNFIHFLLPENIALWLFAWIHSLLYMAGGYFLSRVLGLKRRSAFLIALLLGLGNATPAHLFGGHLTFLPARAYWPWEAAFLLLLLRGGSYKNAIAWAACTALSLAAGAPQIWLFGVLFNLALALTWMLGHIKSGQLRRSFPLQGAALAIGLLVLWCAPILLPLRELQPWSSHGDTLSFAEVTNFSATPKSLFRLLLNGFYGGNSFVMWSLPSNPGEDAASIGLAAFLLALVAPFVANRRRVVWPLFAGCLLLLLLALGSSTPLYSVLYEHISLFRSLRVPARWLELWAFGAAILAGFSFDAILRHPKRAPRLSPLWIGGAIGCFALLIAVFLNLAPFQGGAKIVANALALAPEKLPSIAQGLQNEALMSCLIGGLTLALLAWFWQRGFAKGIPQHKFVLLILAVLAAEPLANFWLSVRIAPPEVVNNARIPSDIKAYAKPGQRWIVRAPFGQLNAPLLAGIGAVNGYEPFGSRPFFELAEAAQPGTHFSADFQPRAMSPLWRVAGASHLLWKPKRDGDNPTQFPGRTIVRSGEWRLNSLEDGLIPWPHSYLTRQVVHADGQQAFTALQSLARQRVGPTPPALIANGFPLPPNQPPAKNANLKEEITTPDLQSWTVVAPQDTALIENETMAPGWKAFVDGKPAKIYPANAIFRGVFIPAGTQKVVIVLDSQTLRFSLFLALLGLMLAAARLIVAPTPSQPGRRPTTETPS